MGQLEDKMNRIINKRGLSNEGLTSQFGGIFAGLEELDTEDALTPDEMKALIRELRDIVKDANKVGKPEDDEEGVFDEETVDALNAQTNMETRIAQYRTRVMSIEGNEDLVAELLGLLDEADGLLVQAEDAIGLEDEALAEELTEAAEGILDQFEELFDEFEEELGTENNGKSNSSNGKGKPNEESEDPEEPESDTD
jgi:DNA-binding phage protein